MQTNNSFSPDLLTDSDVRKDLEDGEIETIVSIEQYLKDKNKIVDYTNEVLLVSFKSGRMGVFKPEEKNEAWDDGSAEAEVAAYRASRLLNFHCVPPTVMRTIHNRNGSLQLFLESDFDSCDKAQFQECIRNADSVSLATLKVFDFIFGQWDRRLSNILFLEKGERTFVNGIDNTKIISRQQTQYGQRPFVSVLEHESLFRENEELAFPFRRAETMVAGDVDFFQNKFGDEAGSHLAKVYKNSSGMRIRHVIWRGHFWQQPFAFDTDEQRSIKPFSAHLPLEVRRSIEKLDRKMLGSIFSHARCKKFLTAEYFDSILGRRDQILRYFSCVTDTSSLEVKRSGTFN